MILHQHVKINSLFLLSCFWKRSLDTSITFPTEYLKHKTMLYLLYSSGPRAGEDIQLKLKDVDSKRGLIHIRKAKGFKDRTVMLSDTLAKA